MLRNLPAGWLAPGVSLATTTLPPCCRLAYRSAALDDQPKARSRETQGTTHRGPTSGFGWALRPIVVVSRARVLDEPTRLDDDSAWGVGRKLGPALEAQARAVVCCRSSVFA
ncbi:hypothetical protein ACCO45_013858 [Purpureocillium lilacinum]|uniref:Uncharacterized protein n=1 Tax=Purpureocillium lilacinum TaxID=33203 RepID=A0ACC4D751_PURLI